MSNTYKTTEFGTLFLVQLGVVLAAVLPFLIVMTNQPSVYATVGFVAAVFILLFFSITIEVADGKLRFSFGVGAISKEVALSDITSAEIKNTPWYFGWGFRGLPRGWLYRVSGTKGVHVVLKNGKEFRLGSNDPEAVLRAIRPSDQEERASEV